MAFGTSLCRCEILIVEKFEGGNEFFAYFRQEIGECSSNFHAKCGNTAAVGGGDAL